jgi:hypothetical protein
MKSSSLRWREVALASILLACGSSSSTTTGPATDGGVAGDGGGGAADASGDTSCEMTLPKSQTLSQPCCTGWGVDACGALLFCAALDGRTQATCYPQQSRKGGESCAADSWCASKECAPDGKCRATGAETCDQTTGCASVRSVPYGCTAAGTCKACDATATDPRCPAICTGQDPAWTSTSCRICQSSTCCAELAACTADNGACAPRANTMLACSGPSFQACVDVAFKGVTDPISTSLKQCFTGAVQSCAGVCP